MNRLFRSSDAEGRLAGSLFNMLKFIDKCKIWLAYVDSFQLNPIGVYKGIVPIVEKQEKAGEKM